MKTYKIKNYKGNLVESLKKFHKIHDDLRVVEATEKDNQLKIVAEKKMSRQELDDFTKKLDNGAVQFQYYKKDGSLRNACGTRMTKLMSAEDIRVLEDELKKPSIDFLIPYYDFQSKGVRKFHISRFVKIVDSVSVSDSNAQKVKNAIEKGAFDSFDDSKNKNDGLAKILSNFYDIDSGASDNGNRTSVFSRIKNDGKDKVNFFQDIEYKIRRILHNEPNFVDSSIVDKLVSEISNAIQETLDNV